MRIDALAAMQQQNIALKLRQQLWHVGGLFSGRTTTASMGPPRDAHADIGPGSTSLRNDSE